MGPSSHVQPGLWHRHEEIELAYVELGALTYGFAEEEIIVRENAWCVFWAGFPHQIRNSFPAQQSFWLTLPLDLVLQWQLPAPGVRSLLSGQVFVGGQSSRRSLDRALWRSWQEDFRGRTCGGSRWTLLEIESRVGRLVEAEISHSPTVQPQRAVAPGNTAGSITRLAAFLSEHYAEPFRWAEAAQQAGLSPELARRRFHDCFGMTLHQYLVRLRLARAKQLLATGNSKIIDVAMASGFPTLSNFYRTFESTVGRTPSEYRKSCRNSS